MEYKLSIASIYELGKRENQEDNMYPAYGTATGEERLFIVCDGMGGHESGEVASSTVCEVMAKTILSKSEPLGTFTDEVLYEALDAAYEALDKKDTGTLRKMGTTMTLLKFHADGCTLAHIGDSRIYHIRGEQVLFVTSDHSLVNDFVKAELITKEQAKTHPQRHVITRAMQPLQECRSLPDVYHTADIQAGDYFLLCTDGINESLDDEDIANILSNVEWNDDEKVNKLIQATQESKDNHTAYLIHVLEVKKDVAREEGVTTEVEELDGKIQPIVEGNLEQKTKILFKFGLNSFTYCCILLLMLGVLIWILL